MKKTATFILTAVMTLMLCNVKAQSASTTDTLLIGDTTNMVVGVGVPYQAFSSSYTQELVMDTEMNGAAMITGIDLYCGNSGMGRQCTVYLANTYRPRLDSLVPYGAMFQQVVVDTFGRTDGWNHFEFSTPFYYTGFGNLMVAFDCPWTMGGGDYYCEYTQNISRYAGVNMAYLTPSYPTTAKTYRNIMRLHTQPVPVPAATCPAPTVMVDSIGPTEVRVKRIPGNYDLSWNVECITDGDNEWQSGGYGTGDTLFTMAGLTPNTHYTFRINAVCADTTTSVLKHILTNCVPDTVPFVEDFDEMSYLPGCWSTTPGTAGEHPNLEWLNYHSSHYSIRLNGGTLVLPPFDVPTDSLEIAFWAKNGTTNATLNLLVGAIVDPLDPATFIPVDTITLPRSWTPVVVRFDGHPGIVGRIAIRPANPIMTYMYVDDIEVQRITPCQTITAVSVDQVTDTASMVHWVDTAALYYEVAYGPQGFTIDSSHIVTNIHADSLLLGGLMPYTNYDVYVRSFCGSSYTNWSPMRSFRTFCSLLDTLPYAEDFDSYTGNPSASELPCWRGQAGLTNCVVSPAGGGYSGTRALRWMGAASDPMPNEYAILPGINTALLPLHTLQLSFWAKNMEDIYNRYDTARLVVGVMSDPENFSTFQPVDTVVVIGDNWHRYDVPLNGTGNYIVIKSCQGLGTRGRWFFLIDDLLLEQMPACPSVTELALSALTATTATVRWDGQSEDVVWQTCIDTDPTVAPVADTTVLTSAECTFSDLATGTPYYVWVRSVCTIKGDTSLWEGPLQVVPGVWNMRANKNDSLTVCGVTIYDDGGAGNDFSHQHSSLVLMPDMAGHLVSVSGHCDIGSVSSLTLYDGVGTSGNVLWTKVVNSSQWPVDFGPVISETGPVTLVFDGNTAFYTYEGFELQVSCIPDTCIVHHLQLDSTVVASDSTLALAWDCNGASSYEVEYGPVGFAPGTGTQVSTSSTDYVITGLSSLDRLEVHVRSLCGEGDTGAWARGIFNTEPCGDAIFRDNFGATMQYDLTSVGPVGYNGTPYSYVQTLVTPAHLAGLNDSITAMAFRPGVYVEGSHMNNVTVWLANVADTALNDGLLLPDADHHFVKVIDSGNFCHTATTDWQTLRFDRPFLWDGHSTLLVAVLREDGGDTSIVTQYSCHFRHRDLMDTVYRSHYIIGYNPIDIDSARSYTDEYYYYAHGSTLTGDLRLIGNLCDTTGSSPHDTTGIDNISTYQSVNVYPNPTHGKVTVTSPDPLASAIVTDMMGRKVYTQTLKQSSNQTFTIDLGHLPQGAYFLILTTVSGKTHTVKLMKMPDNFSQ